MRPNWYQDFTTRMQPNFTGPAICKWIAAYLEERAHTTGERSYFEALQIVNSMGARHRD